MSNKLSLSIITPTGTMYKGEGIDQVNARTPMGMIGILTHHIPLFTKLEHDEVEVIKDGKEQFFTVFQGFLHLDPQNNITILADNAQRSEELNVEVIRKAKEMAEKALEQRERLSATEILRAETAIRRAIMELRVVQKRGGSIT